MELYRHVAHISVFVTTILCVSAWQCETLRCIIYPLSLKLWKDQIEVSAKSLKVKAGSSFSITCDGSCVGSRFEPKLGWYGPDKQRIAYEGSHNRINVLKSLSRRYLRLNIRKVTDSDQGEYHCQGYLGEERGWNVKSIRLIVDSPSTSSPATTHDSLTRTKATTTPTTISSTAATSTTELPSTRTTSQTTVTTLGTSTPGTVISTSTPIKGTTPATNTTIPITDSPTTNTSTPSSTNTTTMPTNTSAVVTTEEACLSPYFKCGSGECFDSSLVCDSFPDCEDNSDETNCDSLICTESMQACTDGYGCVSTSQICDGIYQCRDQSDEDPNVCSYPKDSFGKK